MSIIIYFSGKLLFLGSFLGKISKKGRLAFVISIKQPVKELCKHRDLLVITLREDTDFV